MNLAKLPRWAQDHIENIQRERDVAVRALNEYCDNQTPGPIYSDELECTGEERGPTTKRRYFQGKRITIEHGGILLDIYTGRGDFIELRWHDPHRACVDIAMVPDTFCGAKLIAKEYMR